MGAVAGVERRAQVVTVAVVVAVTFASWPVYSCWLPSLTGFTLLSLIPLMVTFAVQFGISEALMVLVMIVSCAFILYSGRKLNEMVLASILTDDKNRRLVERLKVEVNQSEKARRQAEHLSEAYQTRRNTRLTSLCQKVATKLVIPANCASSATGWSLSEVRIILLIMRPVICEAEGRSGLRHDEAPHSLNAGRHAPLLALSVHAHPPEARLYCACAQREAP